MGTVKPVPTGIWRNIHVVLGVYCITGAYKFAIPFEELCGKTTFCWKIYDCPALNITGKIKRCVLNT